MMQRQLTQGGRRMFSTLAAVLLILACIPTAWAEAWPTYQPDGTIKSTKGTLTMYENGVLKLVDTGGVTHEFWVSMFFKANGAWFCGGNLLNKVVTINPQTRTTTFTGTIQPPTGSVDTTPFPMRLWMQLREDRKVRIGLEYGTARPILDLLSTAQLRNTVRPYTPFVGHYVKADATSYLISGIPPYTQNNGPIQTCVFFDDVANQRVQMVKVESGGEQLTEYGTVTPPYLDMRYYIGGGTGNRILFDLVLPDEPAPLIPAAPVFQPDGKIVSGSNALWMSGGVVHLVDSNATLYDFWVSMNYRATGQWFTFSMVPGAQQTIDTVNKTVAISGDIIPPPGSLDLTPIPFSYWMQLQTNGTIRVEADYTRSGSILDILSGCDMRADAHPRSAFVGHVIQVDGTQFPIINTPPGTTGTMLASGSIQQVDFMSDSPLQKITVNKVASSYETLADINITAVPPYFQLRYQVDVASNSLGMDITLPPSDANPSSETYGGVDFWKSDNLRMPSFGTSANLVSNPSFEHDLQSWRWNSFGSATASTVARHYVIDSTAAYHGARCLKIIGKQGQEVAQLATFAIPVEAGQTYTLSFYAKADSSAARFWVSGNTALWGTWISGLPGSLALTTSWTRYSYTFTAPNGLVSIGFNLSNPSADCNAWLDAVQIEKTSAATAFTQRPASMSFLTDRQGNLFQPGESPAATVRIVGTPNTSGTLTVYAQDFSGAESKKQTTNFTIAANGETSVAQSWTSGLTQSIYVTRMEAKVGSVTYRDYGRLAVIPSVPLNQPGRQLFCGNGIPGPRFAEWDRQLSFFTKLGLGASIFFDPAPTSMAPLLSQYNITHFSSIFEGGYKVNSLGIDLTVDYDLTTQQQADLQTYAYNKALANPQITYWKLHNEPNTSQLDATHMNQMLAAVGAAAAGVKLANPNAKIITNDPANMWTTSGIPYIDSFLANGGGSFCDIVGIHPYRAQPESPDMEPDCAALIQVLDNRNFTGDVWFTEGIYHQNYVLPIYGLNSHIGLSSDNYRGGSFTYDMGWGERMCAAYSARYWLVAMKYGDRVKLYVDWGLPNNVMLDYDLTPCAEAFSINTLVRTLGGSTYAGQPSIDPAIRSYVFTNTQGQQVAAIWYYSYDTDTGVISPGKMDVTYLLSQYNTSDLEMIDFTGNVSAVASKVQLQPWPIFIRAKTGTATQLINALNQAVYTPAN